MRWASSLLVVMITVIVMPQESAAICKGSIVNPFTDVAWQEIFPIRVAGIKVASGGILDPPDPARSPVCVCPAPPPIFFRVGIPVSFWEPSRMIEAVKDPFCFPSLGVQLSNPLTGGLHGGKSERANGEDAETTFQVHYFIFPVWSILELLTDFVCVEHNGFDVAYMSEIDPLHQDDTLAVIIHPEALVFANPVAQLSCVADSIASNTLYPLAPLFWCMGSFGSAYPLGGHITDEDMVQASAGISSRIIYKLGRLGLLMDTAINLCWATPTPIWVKWNYKLQIARPIRGAVAFPIGRSGLIWGNAKNPVLHPSSDNFLYMLFKKRACCAF